MTNFIPIFPLEVVVFPGEKLNLHIFEQRYIQLIQECWQHQKPFGIPSVINGVISETGTIVQIEKIVKSYPDGRMDITTRGTAVIRILEVIKEIPDKLYMGAIASYMENIVGPIPSVMAKLFPALREMHRLLDIEKKLEENITLTSYQVAHHAGLTLQQEYELLTLLREDQRLEYLKRHLAHVVPIMATMEDLKKKIQLNGHFRELKGFDFHED
jgi:Lon protease-like protein